MQFHKSSKNLPILPKKNYPQAEAYPNFFRILWFLVSIFFVRLHLRVSFIGGFSEYVLWRKKWRSKGFGFTLRGNNDFKLEDFFSGPRKFKYLFKI